jgi:hypothetical protein
VIARMQERENRREVFCPVRPAQFHGGEVYGFAYPPPERWGRR